MFFNTLPGYVSAPSIYTTRFSQRLTRAHRRLADPYGATENAAACKALLTDLIERGLSTERTILVVIDGEIAHGRYRSERSGRKALNVARS